MTEVSNRALLEEVIRLQNELGTQFTYFYANLSIDQNITYVLPKGIGRTKLYNQTKRLHLHLFKLMSRFFKKLKVHK